MTKTILIEGMSCGHCTSRVEKALNGLDGVTVKSVSVDNKNAIVEVNNVSEDLLKETVEDMGFDVLGFEG
jgi:Cu+-exporting ATPase